MLRASDLEKSLAAALIATAGCGAGEMAQNVRPKDPTVYHVINETSCLMPEDPNSPLVVDWKEHQRDALEIAMAKNVVVVSYDCDHLRLLPKCSVSGNYEYKPTTNQKRFMRLRNLDEIRANLPTSGKRLGLDLEAGIKRGATLDITLQTVGRLVTSRSDVSRALLRGECEGATHIVRGATIGAFTMNTNTRGEVGAGAHIFGAGATTDGSSEKTVSVSSGDLEACAKPTTDEKPPTQCSTPVRLHLEKIDEDEVETVQSENKSSSYTSAHPLSLGLRGVARLGSAEGYDGTPGNFGSMVVGRLHLHDNFGIHGMAGVGTLTGRSVVGVQKNDSSTIFMGAIGTSFLLGKRNWPLVPVIETNVSFQGAHPGVEAGLGVELFPSHPFDLRVLGTVGHYPTGQVTYTHPDKPTEPFVLNGVGGTLETGYTF